jgi:hypothetical protein
MGRRTSDRTRSAYIASWRDELLAAELDCRDRRAQRERLRIVLGGRGQRPPELSIKQLDEALEGFIEAQAADDRAAADGAASHAGMDRWIDERLLDRGERLLINRQVRSARLTAARGKARDNAKAQAGRITNSVAMPAESWQALKRLRTYLKVKTLGDAVVLLLSHKGFAPDGMSGGRKKPRSPSRPFAKKKSLGQVAMDLPEPKHKNET